MNQDMLGRVLQMTKAQARSELTASIDDGRAVSLAPGADGWVFPSERLTTPLAKDNCGWWGFLPRLKPVGLAWANFQVMRRTHSPLMEEQNVDPKLVADQLGRSLDVNLNVYAETALRLPKEAANALELAAVSSACNA